MGINKDLAQISHGFKTRVNILTGYDVNNFRFRSEKYETSRPNPATTNTGLFLSCTEDDTTTDYYGVIEDIIELTFEGSDQLKLVLFQCRWFHPRTGIRKSPNIGLVEINPNTRLPGYEPFVLPYQCRQVYYTPYPCKKGDLKNWWVVHQVPKRGDLQVTMDGDGDESPNQEFYQEEGATGNLFVEEGNNLDTTTEILDADLIQDTSDVELLNKQQVFDTMQHQNEPLNGEDNSDVEQASEDSDQEEFYDDPDDF